MPQLEDECRHLQQLLEMALADLNAAQSKEQALDAANKTVREQVRTLIAEKAAKQAEQEVLVAKLQAAELTINGYRGNIGKWEIAVRAAEKELRVAGYDDDALAFLDVEVYQDKIFRREDGSEWTQEVLQAQIDELAQATQLFQYEHKDINEGIIAMVEPQKSRVAQLDEALTKAKRIGKSGRCGWQTQN